MGGGWGEIFPDGKNRACRTGSDRGVGCTAEWEGTGQQSWMNPDEGQRWATSTSGAFCALIQSTLIE